ncbi:hypothetical protein PLICRDRAFT_552661 [Plicaturopsis crispa FD-325 SS-3]|nr:hypothetical protein PLICRDRAFT_552661 [Plicaturopsis crispa FD-325 SS-3]
MDVALCHTHQTDLPQHAGHDPHHTYANHHAPHIFTQSSTKLRGKDCIHSYLCPASIQYLPKTKMSNDSADQQRGHGQPMHVDRDLQFRNRRCWRKLRHHSKAIG